MGMQKYRADKARTQDDGAVLWTAEPQGVLSRVNNCRLANMAGEMRATVYVQGDPDTWFSIPAVIEMRRCYVRGYLTSDDDGQIVFHHCYY